jgi:hypothetical protein
MSAVRKDLIAKLLSGVAGDVDEPNDPRGTQ